MLTSYTIPTIGEIVPIETNSGGSSSSYLTEDRADDIYLKKTSDTVNGTLSVLQDILCNDDVTVTNKLSVLGPVQLGDNASDTIDIYGNIRCWGNFLVNNMIDYNGQTIRMHSVPLLNGLADFAPSVTDINNLTTKGYVDNRTNLLLSSSNVWTGQNVFNTSLPTSALTPTLSNQFVTKTYADNLPSNYLNSQGIVFAKNRQYAVYQQNSYIYNMTNGTNEVCVLRLPEIAHSHETPAQKTNDCNIHFHETSPDLNDFGMPVGYVKNGNILNSSHSCIIEVTYHFRSTNQASGFTNGTNNYTVYKNGYNSITEADLLPATTNTNRHYSIVGQYQITITNTGLSIRPIYQSQTMISGNNQAWSPATLTYTRSNITQGTSMVFKPLNFERMSSTQVKVQFGFPHVINRLEEAQHAITSLGWSCRIMQSDLNSTTWNPQTNYMSESTPNENVLGCGGNAYLTR